MMQRNREKQQNGKDLEISSRKLEGTFHAKMGTIKDRNGMDLTELEDGVGKNTQKNYTKKDLHDPDNHDGVITHLEPDILECEVKWALGSIIMNKVSGGDEIPVELFHILKWQVLGGIRGRRRRGRQGMTWLDDFTDSMDMSLSTFWVLGIDREAWCAVIHGVTKSRT